jgi:integrase
MGRHQTGNVYYSFGAWHIRYRVTELKGGKPVRVQRSEVLLRDPKTDLGTREKKTGKIRPAKTVLDKAASFMQKINGLSGTVQEDELPITEFWEKQYLPHCEKYKRVSTVRGYKKVWKQHLRPHFTGVNLSQYSTPQATRLLTKLAEDGLGRRAVARVRSLASGLFRYAKQLGVIKDNPWRDSGSLVLPKAPKETPHYLLEEAEAISNALHEAFHSQEQLIFCLAAYSGLRPGEIAGLKWEDIAEGEERTVGGELWKGWLHVRRSVVCGEVGKTKTDESVAPVPLISPVCEMFKVWRIACGNPTTGWVFENRVGGPIDLHPSFRLSGEQKAQSCNNA